MRLFALLLLVFLVCVSAQTDSFCVKHAKALSGKTAATLTGADEFNFISAIIGRLVVGCDNNAAARYGVPGISATTGPFRFYAKSACGDNGVDKVIGLIADPTNAPFFTGFAPNYDSVTGLQALNDAANVTLGPSIRFVGLDGTNVTAYNAAAGIPGAEGLIQHLVSFFGRDFKCSFYDPTKSSSNGTFIGRYAGNDQVGRVHKYMNITKVVWDNFASAFVSTLLSFGVAQSDIDTSIVPYVTQFLQVPPGGDIAKQVCNHPTCECISGFKNVNNVCVATSPAPTTPPKNINTGTIMTFSPMVALATIGLIALL